ncbi:MAG: glutamate-1-semialdehyde 2,1-aminomutase [Deltaproteobacteria bacterium]|nr:glutamate-1-semialdehyde 2,1-aminomutase [Deltaproteobacteria bacterium]
MNREKSQIFFEKAKKLIPGGVNSPVRSFISVNEIPFYVERAYGSHLFDVDGNAYIDYVCSWGAIILGHAHGGLVEEIKDAVKSGTSYGLCHPYEVEFAELIIEAFPSIELLRLTNSGTEATMSAIRLARGYTGKKNIIKFKGAYHGHADFLLTSGGSGMATLSQPESKGVLDDHVKNTHVADFNNIDSVWRIVKEDRDVACVIVEPIMGNMGVILPDPDFLKNLESLCKEKGIVLIFDEVITGFRVAYGGAQTIFGIDPDITCLGKIIGGGFPVGLFGGKRQIMESISPLGGVYQAGTLSGNPVAVRAGKYVVQYLKERKEAYEYLERNVKKIKEEVEKVAKKYKVPYTINAVCGMFSGFFTEKRVRDYESAKSSDKILYEKFFKLMLESGFFFAPSPYEASFLTLAHTEEEITATIEAYEKIFRQLGKR